MASRDWSSFNRLQTDPLNDIINTNISYPTQIVELEQALQPFPASTGLTYPQTLTSHYPVGQQQLSNNAYSQLSSPVQPFPAYTEPQPLINNLIDPRLQSQNSQLSQRTFAFQPSPNNGQSYVSGPDAGAITFSAPGGPWQRQPLLSSYPLMQSNGPFKACSPCNPCNNPAQSMMPMVSSSYAQVLAQATAPPVIRAPARSDETFNQFIDPSMYTPLGVQRAAVEAPEFPYLASGISTTDVNLINSATNQSIGHPMNMTIRNRKPPRIRTPSVISSASRRTVTPRSRRTSGTIYYCNDATVDGTVCGKLYKTMKKLEYHRRSHDPAYKYACADCEMYFKIEADLTHHRKNVHMGKDANLLRCHQCNKGFVWQPYLDRHLLTHSGAKPFRCLICNNHRQKRFDNLQRHYKNVHPSMVPPKKEDCFMTATNLTTPSDGTADTAATGGSYPALYLPPTVESNNIHLVVPR